MAHESSHFLITRPAVVHPSMSPIPHLQPVMVDPLPLRQRPLSERIAHAEAIARENIAGPFGVLEFAEAAGLSRSRFSVTYQSHRGQSAGVFLRTLRMDRAVELLKNTELPVAKVGCMVGYPEPTGFGRAFRRHTGLSPSRFRATARKAGAIETRPPESNVRVTNDDRGLIAVPSVSRLRRIATR